MNTHKDLNDLINILRKGTPAELGKAWKERYQNLYKNPNKNFDDFVHSPSKLPDLDDPTLIFNGKVLN
jgi:hypothetical protein